MGVQWTFEPRSLEKARRALASGQVVALPTDTVYGLAVDPFQAGATDRLFALKGRPREVQVPILVADDEQAGQLTSAVPEMARRLMSRFWPGPLTLVLPRRPGLGVDLGADQTTVGVRRPAHAVPTAVCRRAGPLATTSANLHGQPPLTTAQEVTDAFGAGVTVVIDGGTCAGAPSTVVGCTGREPELLRQGGIPWEEVLAAAGSTTGR